MAGFGSSIRDLIALISLLLPSSTYNLLLFVASLHGSNILLGQFVGVAVKGQAIAIVFFHGIVNGIDLPISVELRLILWFSTDKYIHMFSGLR